MAMKRALFSLIVVAGMMWLAGCDHYTCSTTFGASTCTPGTTTTSPSNASAFAFAVDQNGSIDGYTLEATAGTFEATPGYTTTTVPANLGSAGVVVAQGKFLYAVFEDLQQIYGWTIDSTGNLTALSGMPITDTNIGGIGLDAYYNEQVVITNPTGTLLFVSEAGNNQILVYQISSSGAVTAAAGSPFSTVPAGIEPENLAMDGLGKYLYVSEDSGDHSGSIVVGYSVSSSGGLTEIGSTFFNDPIWEMQGDASGKYMIGISGKTAHYYGSDDDNIYVYAIDSPGGALSAVAGSPFATQYAPFNIAVQPGSSNGEYVYSFSINDAGTEANPIEGYQLNTSTGALSPVSASPFTSLTTPTAWGQFDPSGAYLFFYSGAAPSVSLGALSVGTSGGLTAAGSTAALTTSGYWAASDVP